MYLVGLSSDHTHIRHEELPTPSNKALLVSSDTHPRASVPRPFPVPTEFVGSNSITRKNGSGESTANEKGIETGNGKRTKNGNVMRNGTGGANPIVTRKAIGNGEVRSADNGSASGNQGGGPTNTGGEGPGTRPGDVSRVTAPESSKPYVSQTFPNTTGDVLAPASTAFSRAPHTSHGFTPASNSEAHSQFADIVINPSQSAGYQPVESRLARGHGISDGAIASIAIVITLLLLGVFLFLFRKRLLSRCRARPTGWWDRVVCGKYGAVDRGHRNSAQGTQGSRASIASGFPTSVGHSLAPHSVMEFALPPSPPMAELLRDGVIPLTHSQLPRNKTPTPFFPEVPLPLAHRRTSVHSSHTNDSSRSDGYSQYLLAVHNDLVNASELSSISVRPFTPPESVIFPSSSPSSHRHHSGDWSGARTPTSSITLTTLNSSARLSPRSRTPPPTLALVHNPFATRSTSRLAELAVIETIKRPYLPLQPGELRVAIADSVKILQLLDNDWAVVEKILPLDEVLGTAEQTDPEPIRGLIPVECFLWDTEDPPLLVADRRSSVAYAESVDPLVSAAQGISFMF